MIAKPGGSDPQRIPAGERKRLLRSNIRSILETSSIDKLSERKAIEERLNKITSLKIVDPEIERIEIERRIEMEKARKNLLDIEKDIEEEAERILREN